MAFSYDEAETLLHIARDATTASTFESRITVVTDHLSTLVPYTSLSAMVIGPEGPSHILCRNTSPDELSRYAANYMPHDPMVKGGPFGKEGAVATLSDVVSDQAFGRDAFTGEFLATQKIRYLLGVSPPMPDGSVLSLALHREQALGDFTDKERQLIRLAYPDLGRAVFGTLLQEKVARMTAFGAGSATQGGLVFDARGDILRADDTALGLWALLRDAAGISADQIVVEVRRLARSGPGAATERPFRRATGGRIHLRLDTIQAATGTQVVGQLRVERPTTMDRVQAFSRRHRLSPRESDVVALAADGLGNRHIGFKLGISEITVGTHLSKVYRKTGVTNRTELAKALLWDEGLEH